MLNFNKKIFDYIIHFPNKLFFPLLKKNKKVNKIFSEFGFIHKKYALENKNLANEINMVLNKLDIKKIIDKEIKDNPKIYSLDIFEYLNKKLKLKINNFFNNTEQNNIISSMLGIRVKLRKVILIVNFYNKQTLEHDGAKMFHRDSDSLQDQVKIFMLINDIDSRNGMFYFVPKNFINDDYKVPFESDRLGMELRNKWRNYDKTVLACIKNINIDQSPIMNLQGIQGEMLYIDTGKLYHKGGYISEPNKKRFLLQAVYTPILSLSNWNSSRNLISKFFQNKLTSLRIKLMRTIKI